MITSCTHTRPVGDIGFFLYRCIFSCLCLITQLPTPVISPSPKCTVWFNGCSMIISCTHTGPVGGIGLFLYRCIFIYSCPITQLPTQVISPSPKCTIWFNGCSMMISCWNLLPVESVECHCNLYCICTITDLYDTAICNVTIICLCIGNVIVCYSKHTIIPLWCHGGCQCICIQIIGCWERFPVGKYCCDIEIQCHIEIRCSGCIVRRCCHWCRCGFFGYYCDDIYCSYCSSTVTVTVFYTID